MRQSKKLALVLSALALATAFSASAASASDTVLCEGPSNPCPQSQILPAGSYLAAAMSPEFKGTGLTIKTSNGLTTATCTTGVIGAQSTAEAGSPLPGVGIVSAFSTCPVSMNAPSVAMTAASGGDGTMTVGNAAEHLQVTITVFGRSYVYGSASVPFHLDAKAQTLKATNVTLSLESGAETWGKTATLNVTEKTSAAYLSTT